MGTYLRFPAVPGYVYVIALDNCVKVGATTRDPHLRFSEICHSRRQVEMFEKPELYYAAYVDNCWQTEHVAHQILSRYSVDGKSEYFKVSPVEAAEAVDKAIHIFEMLITA